MTSANNPLLTRHRRLVLVALAVVLLVGSIAAIMIRSRTQTRRIEILERTAEKFNDYCRFVRINLKTTQSVLEGSGQNRHQIAFRQHIADSFYSNLLQIDHDAVSRCAVPEVASSAVSEISQRCKPPSLCVIAEPGDPKCQVDQTCLRGVLAELLLLLPSRR